MITNYFLDVNLINRINAYAEKKRDPATILAYVLSNVPYMIHNILDANAKNRAI